MQLHVPKNCVVKLVDQRKSLEYLLCHTFIYYTVLIYLVSRHAVRLRLGLTIHTTTEPNIYDFTSGTCFKQN